MEQGCVVLQKQLYTETSCTSRPYTAVTYCTYIHRVPPDPIQQLHTYKHSVPPGPIQQLHTYIHSVPPDPIQQYCTNN